MNGDLLGRMLTGAARMGLAGWQAQQQGQQPGLQRPLAQGLNRPSKLGQPMATQAPAATNRAPDIRRALGRPSRTPPPGGSGGAPPNMGPYSPFMRRLQGR